MRLKQNETIQILRKRAGLNQGELGSRAFNTSIDSGRTKIKNIELGKQRVTDDDLARIARCLDVTIEQLQTEPERETRSSAPSLNGILISRKVTDLFPDLGEYLLMLEKASEIDDYDLIDYLSKKIADIWSEGPKMTARSAKNLTIKT